MKAGKYLVIHASNPTMAADDDVDASRDVLVPPAGCFHMASIYDGDDRISCRSSFVAGLEDTWLIAHFAPS